MKAFFQILFLFPFISFSQNLNHWNNFYGSESKLLQGSNVGSVADFSAVYHNPANIALIDGKSIEITLNAYRYNTFHAKNRVSKDVTFRNSELTALPALLAGNISFLSNEKNKFSYSYISKTIENNELILISDPEAVDLFGNSTTGNELLTNSVLFHKKFSDDWVGLTWSHQLTKRINVGVSSFVSILSGYSNSKVNNNILIERDKLVLITNQYVYNINPISSINKIGASFIGETINIGTTITLPAFRIMGKGNFSNEAAIAGFRHLDTSSNDIFVSNVQKKVKASYYRPFSASLGITLNFGKLYLSGAAEYFGSSEVSNPLEVMPYASLSNDNIIESPALELSYKSVINYSLGMEYKFSNEISGFLGYSRDNNPYNNSGLEYENSQLFNIVNSNFNNASIGVRYIKKSINFILGLSYSTSQATTRPSFDILTSEFFNEIEEEVTTITQKRYQVFFGLTLPVGI